MKIIEDNTFRAFNIRIETEEEARELLKVLNRIQFSEHPRPDGENALLYIRNHLRERIGNRTE